jgi:hypothetical protein
VPIVTGRVDPDLLDRLAAKLAGKNTDDLDGESIRSLVLTNAVSLLSGPGRLASILRTGNLTGAAASISLPLDLGTSTETIPPHHHHAQPRRQPDLPQPQPTRTRRRLSAAVAALVYSCGEGRRS